ncbi:hypothetical protein VTJ49DRAFT_4370 [Mycothermus thermophilus]|uniref:AB hydrolase-1 domain-containing protein n=1 Tax=Humicola insolens TaxID=85995 RepID=A0ABR3VMA1_HUMIN
MTNNNPNNSWQSSIMAPSANVDKLTPTDSRVQHCFYTIPGSKHNVTYHYLLATPRGSSPPRATVLLIHGFPDLAFGWRYQVPRLTSMGLRVIVPDMPGYGRSTAPEQLEAYSFKTVADDLAKLVRHVQGKKEGEEVEKIIIGGHDWGGVVVWRFALWHPEMLRGVFSVCTPFMAVRDAYLPPEVMVEKRLPNFGYQLQFGRTEVDEFVVGRERMEAFLRGVYRARRDDRKPVFTPTHGVHLDRLEPERIGQSPLLDKEEIEFYTEEYLRNGIRGPLCWYKTAKINFEEELELLKLGRIRVTVPALYIGAKRDVVLPPVLMDVMEEYFDDLVRHEVDGSHWALWEVAEDCNRYIAGWVEKLLKEQKPLKASI